MNDSTFGIILACAFAAFVGTVMYIVLPTDIANLKRGYVVEHNGTEYVQIAVINDKSYDFVESMLAGGEWEMQGNPAGRHANHFTLVRSDTQ